MDRRQAPRYPLDMSMALPAGLMIASGSVHAVVNAIVKGKPTAPASDGRTARMTARASTDGVSALIMIPFVVIVAWPRGAWPWLLASAVVHLAYLYAMIRVYTIADYSAAYPVMRGSAPLLTALASVALFGDSLSPMQLGGIGLVGGSMLALAIGRHLTSTALGWACATGAMTALYTVADAHGVASAPSVASYVVWDFVLIGTESVLLFAALSRGRIFVELARQWRPCVAAGAMSVVTYGLALLALSMGPTAPLAALRETGMVTALFISAMFLGEKVDRKRVSAVIGIVAGAGLILAP